MAQYCERADTNTGANMMQLEREFGTHPLDWTGQELRSAYRGVETGEGGMETGPASGPAAGDPGEEGGGGRGGEAGDSLLIHRDYVHSVMEMFY